MMNVGGILGGLGNLIEKLSELAEKGKELRESGEFTSEEGKVQGVYGFTIRTGLGKDGEEDIKVEPFGNVHKDRQTGKPVVHEVREPIVDLFDESDHVLVIAELPGVGAEDVRLELHSDLLIVEASKEDKKYRKEVHLPQAFADQKMTHTCHHGLLEIRLEKEKNSRLSPVFRFVRG